MNLNKLLCKYLGEEDKGYVTIGDLITAATSLATILIICAGYVRGATLLIRGNYYETGVFGMPTLPVGGIDLVCIVIAAVFTAIVFAAFLVYVLAIALIIIEDIWHTEIATCERTDGGDE